MSTADQTVDNQIGEIEAAGYQPDAIYTDVVSGKVRSGDRPEFSKLVDAISRTKQSKRLVVTKLDRLGRDALDVQQTVRQLSESGCAVRVLQLGDLDLTTSAGKLVMATLSAVAEMERDLLVERTQAGLARARKEGKRLGRPRAISPNLIPEILHELEAGTSVSEVARNYGVSRATVIRVRENRHST